MSGARNNSSNCIQNLFFLKFWSEIFRPARIGTHPFLMECCYLAPKLAKNKKNV